jgi:predicted O-methyltransferase YrrM
MNDDEIAFIPKLLGPIHKDTDALGFAMSSESRTGALLRVLAASKPGGRLLEIGTGTGVGTAWLLAGMDAAATLDSVDTDEHVLAIAKRHLGGDPRVAFHLGDAAEFLAAMPTGQFDFIYADAWAGKFTHLELALSRLRPGGIYFVDDLLPQSNWPDGHAAKVPVLIRELESRRNFAAVKLSWASGLMILVRTSGD